MRWHGAVHYLGAVALVCAYAALSLWFINRDHHYPNVDESVHLSHATILHYHLREREPGWASALFRVSRFYPPGVPLGMGATQFLWQGDLRVGALFFNVLSTAVTALLVFVAGRKIVGSLGGWTAIVVYLSSPLTFRLSTEGYLDQGLVLTVFAAVLLLAVGGERGLCRPWFWFAAGAGLLVKWTFPLFLVGAAAVPYLRSLRRGTGHERQRLIAYALFSITPFLFWAAMNDWRLFGLLRFANELGVRTQANPLPDEPAFYTFYPVLITREVLPFPLALLALLGVTVAVRHGEAGRLLGLHAVSSFLFLTALLNKDARFIAPLLPAMSVLVAAFVCRLRWPQVCAALVALAALAAFARAIPDADGPPLITLSRMSAAMAAVDVGGGDELRLFFRDETDALNPYAVQTAAVMARVSMRRRPQVVFVPSCAEAQVCIRRPPQTDDAGAILLQDVHGAFAVFRSEHLRQNE